MRTFYCWDMACEDVLWHEGNIVQLAGVPVYHPETCCVFLLGKRYRVETA